MKMKTTSSARLLASGRPSPLASPAFAAGPARELLQRAAVPLGERRSRNSLQPRPGRPRPLDNAEAVAATQSAFEAWGAVPTSTVAYLQGAELPLDVDITNYGPFFDATAPDGLSRHRLR